VIGRDIYCGEGYVRHFQPEDRRNPFRRLYAAKRADVTACLRGSLDLRGMVLDLGGGPGRLAVPLASRWKVTLGDISQAMLDAASAEAERCGVPRGNLTLQRLDASCPLPFTSGVWDVVVCIDLLVHLPEPLAALMEIHRVLKPHGELLVDISNSSPWWILRYPRALGRKPSCWRSVWAAGGVPPEWQGIVRHRRRAEFVGMLRAAGFEVRREWRYGPAWCPVWFLARCRPALG
jgi:ubiquinone/menaquinone biosynthesis C-methylase UbiE